MTNAFNRSGAGVDISKGDVIDLRGLTVLPGFIDTHVHCKCANVSNCLGADQLRHDL